jgi:hypothetical protein
LSKTVEEDEGSEAGFEVRKPTSAGVQAQERPFSLSRVRSLGEEKRLCERLKPLEPRHFSRCSKEQPLIRGGNGRRGREIRENLSIFTKALKR